MEALVFLLRCVNMVLGLQVKNPWSRVQTNSVASSVAFKTIRTVNR